MPHTNLATSRTPALIVYLIDCSRSMGRPLGSNTRIGVVNECLIRLLKRMVKRSTKGELVSPRYRISIIAYATRPTDVLPGILTCSELAKKGMPQFQPTDPGRNTAAAFLEAGRVIEKEMAELPGGSPAPRICHLTAGEPTDGGDPFPHVQRILNMPGADGNVLVQNVFLRDNISTRPIRDVMAWSGFASQSDLTDAYARRLFEMSSPLPESYRSLINEDGYALQAGSRMLFPGQTHELVECALALGGATPTI